MAGHISVLGYFTHADMVVKAVMFILLAASVASWTLVMERYLYFRAKRLETTQFLKRFWRSHDLSQLYVDIEASKPVKAGAVALFFEGFQAYWRGRKQPQAVINQVERVMQIAYEKESIELKQHLPFFASVGSISPYIGLFGTVWGIMNSFQALGHAQQATIAMVAPGISEALVATALGLFAAIPAVIAFNRFATASNQILGQFELFQQELIALIEQQSAVQHGSAAAQPQSAARESNDLDFSTELETSNAPT